MDNQPIKKVTQWTIAGYESRRHYLQCLSEEMGIGLDKVIMAAQLLGPSEDFDGLVIALEDENW